MCLWRGPRGPRGTGCPHYQSSSTADVLRIETGGETGEKLFLFWEQYVPRKGGSSSLVELPISIRRRNYYHVSLPFVSSGCCLAETRIPEPCPGCHHSA